jgi:hypothetical protein
MPTTDTPSLPGTGATAAQLRERARSLRRLATAARDGTAAQLWRRAGADTWVGPLPQACLDDLVAMRRRLLTVADDLDLHARRLEIDADQAEVAARAVPVVRT